MSAPSLLTPAPAFWLNRLLAVATLLSAWLLFQVEPIAAKRILPWFGGGAGVWTAALLFFQTALLAGYLYAHLVAARLAPRTQVLAHAGLLLAVTLLLAVRGVLPADDWKPDGSDLPAWHILVMLAAFVGLPYLLLAATAPLVQVWFARANPGRSPYRLYALSNLGSLAALLSYPFLVEPNLGVTRQGAAWSILFAVFALLLTAAGVLSLQVPCRRPRRHAESVQDADSSSTPLQPIAEAMPPGEDAPHDRSRWLQHFFWIALPACASVALLAVTNYLCQDVAAIPLLWVLPLAVYLVTFILAFDSDRWYRRWAWLAGLAYASYLVVWTWYQGSGLDIVWQVSAHLALLLCLGMACHGELARMRPALGRLTSYYLSIAAGGALGGFLAAVVAPLALQDRYELQLSIAAAWLLAVAVLVTDPGSAFYDGRSFKRLAAMAALFMALVTAMGSQAYKDRSAAIAMARNFYGVLKVKEVTADPGNPYYQLVNGRISHGAQYLATANRRVPAQYYQTGSGVGKALQVRQPAPRRVGVVGLGTGTLAAYAEPGDDFLFYDINPQVVDFADRYFTYLADARQRAPRSRSHSATPGCPWSASRRKTSTSWSSTPSPATPSPSTCSRAKPSPSTSGISRSPTACWWSTSPICTSISAPSFAPPPTVTASKPRWSPPNPTARRLASALPGCC